MDYLTYYSLNFKSHVVSTRVLAIQMKISFLFLQLENFLVAKKPSYEKLERKIKELEKQAVERKRAAEELKAQKNALQTIVDSVASGIDIVTYDYKVQW
jgi:hypothetical protein